MNDEQDQTSTPTAAPNGVKRREFLKVLGVGTAATTMLGCASEKVEKLIPYLVSPDQTVPGVSNYYATTCRECSAGCGVIAETRDGRTVKLEGNPEHPVNRGALCARGQAALQGLYNPDRYRGPMARKGGQLQRVNWDEALQIFAQKLGETRSRGGAGNAVFINQHESGSFPGFLDAWLAGFGMPAHLSYDAGAEHGVIAANRQSYGVAWPRLDFKAARLIISIGADFLDTWGAMVPQQLDFAEARADHENAPRLIYVGPRRSLTGLNADQWIDCRPGSEMAIVRMLQGQLATDAVAQATGVDASVLDALGREFAASSPAMVLAGGGGTDGFEVALAANALNQAHASGSIKPAEGYLGFDRMASPAELRALVGRMNSGGVSLLMVRGANPVFTLPKAAGFTEAMAKVPFKVSFSSYPDETTELADLILPDHHSLEQWGDVEPVRGTISLQQPAMDPVFDTRATSDVLIAIAKKDPGAAARYPMPDYRTWLTSRFPGGAAGLAAALPRGIAPGSLGEVATARPVPAVQALTPIAQSNGNMFLVVYPHPFLGDGRGANKPWLQEIPDPVTKICWQTVAEMNPVTAERMGFANGDMVTIKTSAGSLTLPVLRYPGIQRETVAIATGRGHARSGRYAKAGFNPLEILPVGEDRAGGVAFVSTRADVSKAGGYAHIVTTEGSARQHGRGIGQAIALADLKAGRPGYDSGNAHASEIAQNGGPETPQGERPEGGAEHGEEMPGDAHHGFLPGLRAPVANDAQGEQGDPNSNAKGMYAPNHWSGMAKRRWAMTVDLARCTGCAACVSACYAENNIPTVGADWQVPTFLPDRTGFGANLLRSREMAWIRIERYYEGPGGEDGTANFDTRFVPMMCQHCGNAPCEPVCPVYATYHSPDGLNVQVYNRCVGTRYCSNNCPYKVRYFNWFGYGEPARPQYAFPEPLNWQLNPDVTVRGKGVMEKCSFCVQRIREAENRATLEKRALKPDEFTTACAASCPSRAIVFGDAADENWTVTQLAKDARAYHVFEELNTYTAVVYLKKVTHPATEAGRA
ncbi:MAG: molybdopterin-dependent oxidoreductase [Gemmatimonadaceae bacterium]|jgi:anaerobic selenocysteine-containing dehydrogenase/Fe-S-cluster-containing dehydrogenase component